MTGNPAASTLHEQLPSPPFWCPLPSARHPEAGSLGADALEWARERGVTTDPARLRRLEQADLGELTARTMPLGHSAPLGLAARVHAVLFAVDDDIDEGAVRMQQLAAQTSRTLALLEPSTVPRPDDTARALALREIRLALETHGTPQQVRRWVAGMDTYLSAVVREAALRQQNQLPSLADYVPMWMGAIGMAPSTALIPIVSGHEVPEDELDRPQVRALTEMTWALVAFDNDLYSRSKELERAGDDLNLVDVLAHENGWSPHRAQQEAIVLRDRVMTLFLRIHSRIMPEAGPGLRNYLTALGQFVRGHLDWAAECRRYTETAARNGSWWKPEADDDTLRPVPVPSIAWWWQQAEN
ncbi:hypothetical protein [Streptomyces sp. NBC_01187]|uniref:terpene synthase family protein n=1 Tax=Streptomyces sp. NBC_01187 TaxID=2903766 RepID=UPI00386AC45D|nr:hypothetical protein OG220_35980 [Streptomyces sp. NBC_01187]